MAGDKFKRVNAGDGLQIPANTWNALLETAEHRERNAFNQSIPRGAVRQVESGLLVRVKNDSGSDVDQYCPLMLNGTSVFSPTGDNQEPYSFRKTPILVGVTPDTRRYLPFVITQEPIADGEFGLCVFSGMTVATVAVTNTGHSRAEMVNGDTSELKSSIYGSEILFKPSGTGSLLCLINLGLYSREPMYGTAAENIAGGGLGDIDLIDSAATIEARNHYPGQILEGDKVELWEDAAEIWFKPLDYGNIRIARATANITAGSTGDFQFIEMTSFPSTFSDTSHDPQQMIALSDFSTNERALVAAVNNEWFEASPRVC